MSDTLAVGRIGWWRFQNGDRSDQSGNGRDLVVTGTQVNATDKDGIANNAVNLYNSSYYKTNDSTHPLYGLTSWTISMWVNFRTCNSSEWFLYLCRNDTQYTGIGSWYSETTTKMIVNGQTVPRPAKGWHFVVWERLSTGVCNFYIDGFVYGISSLSIPANTNNLIFGKRQGYPNGNYPNADFDEISMYNRILTADERAELLARGVNYNPDTTPPSFNSVNVDTITYNSANLNVNSNEDGKVYYMLLARNATPPTSVEVKANPENIINVTANTTSIFPITSLDVNTNFDLYVVAEDTAGNLQAVPTKLQFTTLDETPPVFNDISVNSISFYSCKLKINSNENGTAYYKLLARDATAPTLSQIKNNPSGTVSLAINTDVFANIKNLSHSTRYDLYIVAEDNSENLQENYTKIQFETVTLSIVNRVLQNLNKIFKSDEYIISLCNSIGIELNAFEELCNKIYLSMFFDTLEEDLGIPLYAKNLQITFPDGSTTEEKRSIIQAKWKSKGKCSEQLLQTIADSWQQGMLSVSFEDGIIKVYFDSSIAGEPSNINELKTAFDKVKPAYLLIEYLYNWLTWELKDSWNLSWAYWDSLNLSWEELEKTTTQP